jgi:hypothetical protein
MQLTICVSKLRIDLIFSIVSNRTSTKTTKTIKTISINRTIGSKSSRSRLHCNKRTATSSFSGSKKRSSLCGSVGGRWIRITRRSRVSERGKRGGCRRHSSGSCRSCSRRNTTNYRVAVKVACLHTFIVVGVVALLVLIASLSKRCITHSRQLNIVLGQILSQITVAHFFVAEIVRLTHSQNDFARDE